MHGKGELQMFFLICRPANGYSITYRGTFVNGRFHTGVVEQDDATVIQRWENGELVGGNKNLSESFGTTEHFLAYILAVAQSQKEFARTDKDTGVVMGFFRDNCAFLRTE